MMKLRGFGLFIIGGLLLLLVGIAPIQAANFDPPANSNIELSPPAIGTVKSTMKATVRADGGRYAFNFSFGAGAVDKGATVEVGDYIYQKAITWTRSPGDILGSWEPHQGAGYTDAYLWQTADNTATPNYTISVTGKRRKKSTGIGGGIGPDVWEDWETDAKQFAVEVTAPAKDALVCQGDTIPITAKATFDAAIITLTHLRIKLDGTQVLDSPTSPATYQWNTTGIAPGAHTIEAVGEGALNGAAVTDSVTQTVYVVKAVI